MMIVKYVLSLASVYVLALIIDALAPNFGSQKNFMQSLKLAVFSMTAAWLAGIFSLLPALSILGLLGLYSLYVLYLGMPVLMKTPEDKVVPYFVVVLIAAVVVNVVIGAPAALTIPRTLRGFWRARLRGRPRFRSCPAPAPAPLAAGGSARARLPSDT